MTRNLMRTFGAVIVSALLSLPAQAGEQPASRMPPGMVQVWLAVLMRGSAWTAEQTLELARLQEAHLALEIHPWLVPEGSLP
jgi:hypothetical protein